MTSRSTPRAGALVALVVVILAVLTACGSSTGSGGGVQAGGSASCAAALKVGGHLYLARPSVHRRYVVTGRVPAVVPGCNDTGGAGPKEKDRTVLAQQIRDVDPGSAVLWRGAVYVRQGQLLPAVLRGTCPQLHRHGASAGSGHKPLSVRCAVD